jgi:crotonobetainyl-CoA:carnitine CoA-transferase CaiB-like acyl-CoA transferase
MYLQRGSADRPAVPKLGEHTDAILRELGFSDAEAAALRAGGAV